MQRTPHSFIKHAKECKNVAFFWKERSPNPGSLIGIKWLADWDKWLSDWDQWLSDWDKWLSDWNKWLSDLNTVYDYSSEVNWLLVTEINDSLFEEQNRV